MNTESLKKALADIGVDFICDEPMSKHTSFCVGGPAEIFICADSEEKLREAIKCAKKFSVPVTVIGNGSNLLVSDKGIEGLTIKYTDRSVEVDGNILECKAGALLSSAAVSARDGSLCGMEFSYGIPGSIGGAVYMNAGAYGGEIKDVIFSCRSLTADGNIITRSKCELELGYRDSIYRRNGEIILSAAFSLEYGDKEKITEKMNGFMERRRSKQPLNMPSAGSTFKRPEGYFAGALIEQCGLKGVNIGGAAVSEKHAGFIVNTGNATCEDIKRLIEKVRSEVLLRTGVTLEPEVIFVGR